MEDEKRGLARLLAVTWALGFLVPIAVWEARHFLGRGWFVGLSLVCVLALWAVNWRHYRWKVEYETIAFYWAVLPVVGCIAVASLAAFAVRHKAFLAVAGVTNVFFYLLVLFGVRTEHRRIRMRLERQAKADADAARFKEELSTLPPDEAAARLQAEIESVLAESRRLSRRANWVIAAAVACVALGAILVALALVHR